MNPLYLGIDFSLNHSGLVIFDGKKEYHLEVIKPKCVGYERLAVIKSRANEILAKYPNIVAACIEDYAYGANGNIVNIGEGGGVLRYELFKKSIPVYAAAIGTNKKYVAFNGSADKPAMIEAVQRRWGVDVDGDDNLADATGLARIAYHKHTGDVSGLSKKEIEAVKATNLEHRPASQSRRRKRLKK